MPGPVFIDCERLSLRTEEREDVERLASVENRPEVRRMLTSARPTNVAQAESEFETYSDDDASIGLLVCRDEDVLGKVVLFRIDDTHGRGELAYWIFPEHQGNGYVTEAAAHLLDYAFTQRRLHKVAARALAVNEASNRVIEKLGFEQVGRYRKEAYVDGEYVDMNRYTLLAADWTGPEEVY